MVFGWVLYSCGDRVDIELLVGQTNEGDVLDRIYSVQNATLIRIYGVYCEFLPGFSFTSEFFFSLVVDVETNAAPYRMASR